MSDFVWGSLLTLLTALLTTSINNRHALKKADEDFANQRVLAKEAADAERARLDVQHTRARAWQIFEHDELVMKNVVEVIEEFRTIYLARLWVAELKLLGVDDREVENANKVIPWSALRTAIGLHAPELKPLLEGMQLVPRQTADALMYSVRATPSTPLTGDTALERIRAGMAEVSRIADEMVESLFTHLQERRKEVVAPDALTSPPLPLEVGTRPPQGGDDVLPRNDGRSRA